MKTKINFLIFINMLNFFYIFLGLLISVSNIYAISPNAVTGKVLLENKDNGIFVDWQKSTNIDGSKIDTYYVYLSDQELNEDLGFSFYEEVNNKTEHLFSSFNDQDLEIGQTYFIAVTAVNNEGEESSNYSKIESIEFQKIKSSETEKSPEPENDETIIEPENIQEELNQTETLNSNNPEINNLDLQLLNAKALNEKLVEISFNKNVKLPNNYYNAFYLEKNNQEIEILKMENLENKVLLTTKNSLNPNNTYKITVLSGLSDLENNPIKSGFLDSLSFTGSNLPANNSSDDFFEPNIIDSDKIEVNENQENLHNSAPEEEKDTTPPEDVSNFRANYKYNEKNEKFDVNLSWTPSKNTEKDLIYHNLATNNGQKEIVAKNLTKYTKNLSGGKKYTFKISTVDENNNESEGKETSIILPETGPALVLAFITIISLFVAVKMKKNF
jgi:hypothetical protein